MNTNYAQAAHVLLSNTAYLDHLVYTGPSSRALTQKDHRVGTEELECITHDFHAPRDVVESAHFFLDNPDQFTRLDTAAGIGPADGFVGRMDLAFAASERLNYRQVVDGLAGVGAQLDNASQSHPCGMIGRQDLQAALIREGPSPEAREVAAYLLRNPEEFDRLDSGACLGLGRDGYIGPLDIQTQQKAFLYGGLMSGASL